MMGEPNRPLVLAMVVSLGAGCGTCQCSAVSAEERILGRIEEAISLAENRNVAGLLDLTLDDFRLRPAGWGRRETGLILRSLLTGDFRLLHPRPGIQLDPSGSQASVELILLMVGKSQETQGIGMEGEDVKTWLSHVPDRASLVQVRLELIEDGGDWMVSEAYCDRAQGGL